MTRLLPLLTGPRSAVPGAAIWLVWLLLAVGLPDPMATPWAEAILILATMVVLPLGLELAREPAAGASGRLLLWAEVGRLPAALVVMASFALTPGPPAMLLTLPWLGVTGLAALAGLLRIRQRAAENGWRRVWKPLDRLAVDAALIFLPVGAMWLTAARLGYQPLGFTDEIVLLTAIHFHYAGFALPLLTGLAAREATGNQAALACIGVVVGVPFTAAGITATQLGGPLLFEGLTVWITALAGLLTALLHLKLAALPGRPAAPRAWWAVAGMSLGAGMVLAAAYGSRALIHLPELDIPLMRALHGTVNAFGFGVAGLIGWSLYRRPAATSTR